VRARLLLALPVTALLVIAAPAPAAPAATVTMTGSNTVLPLVADLAYFYRRARDDAPRFRLSGGTTPVGISDVARGVTSAALAARGAVEDDPPGLEFTTIALSGVCLVTNRANRLPGISRSTIQDMVSGRATSWAQVPGAQRADPLVSAGLRVGAAARGYFTSVFVDDATAVTYAPRTYETVAQVRDYVLATPSAWGYVDLAFTAGLHAVPYEGVPCTRATIRSGAYPAARPLSVVTRGAPAGAVARFLRWVRASRVARRVIATRYVPAR
jgi:phosphate transport system substrate-binding protein